MEGQAQISAAPISLRNCVGIEGDLTLCTKLVEIIGKVTVLASIVNDNDFGRRLQRMGKYRIQALFNLPEVTPSRDDNIDYFMFGCDGSKPRSVLGSLSVD
jgi:hypothetical protein